MTPRWTYFLTPERRLSKTMVSKKFYLFVGILLLGGAIVILLLVNLKRQIGSVNAPVIPNTSALPAAPVTPSVQLTPDEQVKMRAQDEVRRVAVMFGERFGTYSNQSDLSGLKDMYPAMTDSMKIWLQNYIAAQMKNFAGADSYSGVTTRVISSAFRIFDPAKGVSEMLLITQREQSGTSAQVYYQNLTVALKRASDSWKIDSAYWEKK